MRNSVHTLILVVAMCVLPLVGWGQTGTLRGKVSDGSTGEPLQGATVRLMVDGQVRGGSYTDLEGAFTAKAPAGTYKVLTTFVSYVTDTIEVTLGSGVEVVETLLFPETAVREDLEVVITAKVNEASDVAFQQQKKNSVNAIDGVTFDLVQRTGDANVAAAMQRVVGVTVTDGKYIQVRGLGDRYSQTLLNGASLPSLDPSRNTVQMDIFPSNLIDNVVVYKNFTPDLPGNFTGGLIDVRTKDFPDRFTVNVSVSGGYNTNSSFRDDFLTDTRSSTDWLGYDNGLREVPELIGETGSFLPTERPSVFESDRIPTSVGNNEVITAIDQGINSFEAPLYPVMGNSGFDQNYQLSLGNQFNLTEKVTLGVIGSISYRNEFEFTDEGGNGLWTISGPNDERLSSERQYTTNQNTSNSILWGGMGRVSLKAGSNKVSFNYLRNTSGVTQANFLTGEVASNTIPTVETRSLNYFERSLDAFQLNGEHTFGNFTLDWIASRAFSSQNQPDQRFLANFVENPDSDNPTYGFDASENIIAQRYFRALEDQSDDVKVNLQYDFEMSGRKSFVKVGGAYTTKDRVYTQRVFDYDGENLESAAGDIMWNGDPAQLFNSANYGVIDTTFRNERDPATGTFFEVAAPEYGIVISENEIRATEDQYDGQQTVWASYAMFDLPVSERLNVIGGVRFEQTTQVLLATARQNREVDTVYNDFLPALNFIYKATENMNVRAGYSRTLARPAFRELAEIVYLDFLGDFAEEGNPDLTRSLIDNFDIRWEKFSGVNNLISVSAFFKRFQDPIFRVPIAQAANPTFTFDNLNNGNVYGLEFEIKQSLDFISDKLKDFAVNGNVSLIQSAIELKADELEARRANFPGLSDTRPMYFQSPYAVNAELLYNERVSGFVTSLSFNIFGPRLVATGTNNSLDAYEQPRGLLNFSIAKRLGERWNLRFRANNLLNPEYISTHTFTTETMGVAEGTFEDQTYLFQSDGRRGRSFSLSLSYNIR